MRGATHVLDCDAVFEKIRSERLRRGCAEDELSLLLLNRRRDSFDFPLAQPLRARAQGGGDARKGSRKAALEVSGLVAGNEAVRPAAAVADAAAAGARAEAAGAGEDGRRRSVSERARRGHAEEEAAGACGAAKAPHERPLQRK